MVVSDLGSSSKVAVVEGREAMATIRYKRGMEGSLGGSGVWRLPSAQGEILESRDRVPHRAPCMEPASPSACVSASVCVS